MIKRVSLVVVMGLLSLSLVSAMEEDPESKIRYTRHINSAQPVDRLTFSNGKLLTAVRSGDNTKIHFLYDNDTQGTFEIEGRVTSLTPVSKTCFMYTTKDGHWGWHDYKKNKKRHNKAQAYYRRDKLLLGGSFMSGSTNSINNAGSEKSSSEKKEKVAMLLSKSGVLELLTSDTDKVQHREIEFGKGKLAKAVLHKRAQRIAFIPKGSDCGYIYTFEGGSIIPLSKHQDQVLSLSFSCDGKIVYTAGQDGIVRAADTLTGKNLQKVAVVEYNGPQTVGIGAYYDDEDGIVPMDIVHDQDMGVLSVASSPCDRFLATVDAANCVKIWDTQTGSFLKELALPGFVHSCYYHGTLACRFSPDNNTLLVYNKAHRVEFDLAKVRTARVTVPEDQRNSLLDRIVNLRAIEDVEAEKKEVEEKEIQPQENGFERVFKKRCVEEEQKKQFKRNIVLQLMNREIGN